MKIQTFYLLPMLRKLNLKYNFFRKFYRENKNKFESSNSFDDLSNTLSDLTKNLK